MIFVNQVIISIRFVANKISQILPTPVMLFMMACPCCIFANAPFGLAQNATGSGYTLQVLITLRCTSLHSGLSAAIPHANT